MNYCSTFIAHFNNRYTLPVVMAGKISTQMRFNGEAILTIDMDADETRAWTQMNTAQRNNAVQSMMGRILGRPQTVANFASVQPIGRDVASREAAEAAKPNYGLSCRRILKAMHQAGELGLTDEEGQDLLHMTGNSYRPARVGLVKLGYTAKSGGFRLTRSGRKANVWVALVEPNQVELDVGGGGE